MSEPVCPCCGGRWTDGWNLLGNTFMCPGGAVALEPRQSKIVRPLLHGPQPRLRLMTDALYTNPDAFDRAVWAINASLRFHHWGIKRNGEQREMGHV
jgi:hypothetical protein